MRKLNLTKALKNTLPYVLTLILVGIMTFVAEILDEGEIVFPEITALAIGYMVTQKQGWKVNDSRMIALIAICAVAGVLTVRYIKVGLYLEILIAFVFAQILFMFSGTTFAPMISAIVLPVMMQTESFIYPIAAFLLTIAVVLFRRRIAVDSCRIDSHGDNACNCLLHKNVYSACRSIDNFEYDYSE